MKRLEAAIDKNMALLGNERGEWQRDKRAMERKQDELQKKLQHVQRDADVVNMSLATATAEKGVLEKQLSDEKILLQDFSTMKTNLKAANQTVDRLNSERESLMENQQERSALQQQIEKMQLAIGGLQKQMQKQSLKKK